MACASRHDVKREKGSSVPREKKAIGSAWDVDLFRVHKRVRRQVSEAMLHLHA